MVEQFDTSEIAAGERVSYWHDVICRLYCVSDSSISPASVDQFNAKVSQRSIANVGIGQVQASPLLYSRRTDDVRRSPSEDFLASLLIKGQAHLEQNGRHTMQRVGDIVLYDTARAFKYEFPDDYSMVILKIPRKQLLSRLPDAERLTAIALDGQSSFGALAASVIRSTAGLEHDLEPFAAAKVSASVMDIFAAAFETELRGQRGITDRHGDILQRAKDYMQANFSDSDLDVEQISSAIGVSTRTLNRIFASDGTTASRWLWQKRLEASYASLSEGRAQHVGEVAVACGFSDFSHFSRIFKRTYGVAPNTLVKRRP
jgi:AraC-like DNA-binding protein